MKSTNGGPRTQRGRIRSSHNAIRHGILAEAPIVPDFEDPRDWQRHLDGITESYQPEGWHEAFLVQRVAALLWRLHRIQRYETSMIRDNLADVPDELAWLAAHRERFKNIPPSETITMEEIERRVDSRMLPSGWVLPTIMRYESHIHRQYVQTLHELEALQARRRGEHAPLARLDISAPPSG